MLRLRIIPFFLVFFTSTEIFSQKSNGNNTDCNPLNISYRFRLDTPSRREAADPTIVLFKDKYILFASKSGGYWVSNNLKNWNFLTNNQLPWEDYAPTATVMGDELYFMASGKKIFKTKDPITGSWQKCGEVDIPVVDPCLFADDDNRLYLYYGCSPREPTKVVELDINNNFRFIGQPISAIYSDKTKHGFEQKGDSNTNKADPWIEGSWMTKNNGKYYLQYAAPGTEYKSYCDGVYVADYPMGPFVFQPFNPISYKPQGFIAGAGHSGTFKDKFGNYWHISTMSISKKNPLERRLGLFPAAFDKDGTMRVYTGFGDYPYLFPTKKMNDPERFFKGWMLLSYNKPITVSSILDKEKTKPEYAVNEEIRNWWSAVTNNKGEFAMIDLLQQSTINAIQINFADVDTKTLGRPVEKKGYKYLIEYSDDAKKWQTIIDKSNNDEDLPHPYFELDKPLKARYIRIENVATSDGKFALSGFRIFGKGIGTKPANTKNISVIRDSIDKRIVKISWEKQIGVTGYNIRYGLYRDKLYHNYIVFDNNNVTIRSLNTDEDYWFSIDAFNENGIKKSGRIYYCKSRN